MLVEERRDDHSLPPHRVSAESPRRARFSITWSSGRVRPDRRLPREEHRTDASDVILARHRPNRARGERIATLSTRSYRPLRTLRRVRPSRAARPRRSAAPAELLVVDGVEILAVVLG